MLNDDAVLIPGVGHILLGDPNSATKPTLGDLQAFAADTTQVPAGLTDIGHTDLDDIFTPGQDGGDTETKGSWQNKTLREVVTSAVVDYFVVNSMQIRDNEALTLYYGGGDTSKANEFSEPDNPTPQQRAVCVVFIDGSDVVGLWQPLSSIRRDDAMSFASDDFTKMPLRFTSLKKTGQPKSTWIAPELGSGAAVAPTVTGLDPANAATAGGDLIQVNGTDLAGATAVKVAAANVAATDWKVISNRAIAMIAPAHAAGAVDVTVTTPDGTTATSAASKLTYA